MIYDIVYDIAYDIEVLYRHRRKKFDIEETTFDIEEKTFDIGYDIQI